MTAFAFIYHKFKIICIEYPLSTVVLRPTHITMKELLRIVFIDDDQEDLQMLREIAESLGHSAYLLHDPRTIWEQLDKDALNPDIIFLDINLPLTDGFEILKKLRETGNTTPVVIHSGNCDERCIDTAFSLGANYYMKKANSYQAVVSAFEYVFGRDWNTFRPAREEFLHLNN